MFAVYCHGTKMLFESMGDEPVITASLRHAKTFSTSKEAASVAAAMNLAMEVPEELIDMFGWEPIATSEIANHR